MSNPNPAKPFTKGDPRINRKGRPKSFDALRALAQQIAQETATDGNEKPIEVNGHIATNIELVLRAMMKDKRTAQQFVEIAFGKVPQQVEMNVKTEDVNETRRRLLDTLPGAVEDPQP